MPNPRNSRDVPLYSPGSALPYALVTALFFFWAIPNHLNDILIKQLMKSFELTRLCSHQHQLHWCVSNHSTARRRAVSAGAGAK